MILPFFEFEFLKYWKDLCILLLMSDPFSKKKKKKIKTQAKCTYQIVLCMFVCKKERILSFNNNWILYFLIFFVLENNTYGGGFFFYFNINCNVQTFFGSIENSICFLKYWVWHSIASDSEALVLERVEFTFIAITLWSTLTSSVSTC